MRCAGFDRPGVDRRRRARSVTEKLAHPRRLRELPPDPPAVAAPPAAGVCGARAGFEQDRQPGDVGPERPERERAVWSDARQPPGVDRPAPGRSPARLRLYRPPVAGVGHPTLGPWPQPADLDVVQTGAWLLHDERPLPAQLVADQVYRACRVAELGIGTACDGPTPAVEALSAALTGDPDPRDPRASGRRGRHDPRRRGRGGRKVVARSGQRGRPVALTR